MSFWDSRIRCPITLEDREWLEDALCWFEEVFGKDLLIHKKTITPTKEYFDKKFTGAKSDAIDIFNRL